MSKYDGEFCFKLYPEFDKEGGREGGNDSQADELMEYG